ncbi:hypothetical protein Hanom_Chr12g01091411 [Helianthus anomalus]
MRSVYAFTFAGCEIGNLGLFNLSDCIKIENYDLKSHTLLGIWEPRWPDLNLCGQVCSFHGNKKESLLHESTLLYLD